MLSLSPKDGETRPAGRVRWIRDRISRSHRFYFLAFLAGALAGFVALAALGLHAMW
jgi:uncharacterized membrane protein YoaK (UPF0700 family)